MDTEARRQAAVDRLQALKVQEIDAGKAGPPCSCCRFGPLERSGEGPCNHYVNWNRRFDPATGTWFGDLRMSTREARAAEGPCGPEGLLFERRSLWRRMAAFLAGNELN